jgi:radical SAM superfamily enzyme YgiQ (UPF0313 family)
MPSLLLAQLPVPPPTALAATGNVPLASGALAVAVDQAKLNIQVDVLSPELTDVLGDEAFIEEILNRKPDILGFSLYLWNSERTIYLANQIKANSPETMIFLGGPEVHHDNFELIKNSNHDYAIIGEAEESFTDSIQKLLSNQIPNHPNILNQSIIHDVYPEFPLHQFPSPYLTGKIPVDSKRSTYLETVRGCKSECTYCFYPKSSGVLRSLNIPDTRNLILNLKNQGAKELVFLDPTFNHRPNFEAFLDSIIEINQDRQMKMFAEIRPEGINPKIAKKLYKAGFYKLELGMQSINVETLKRVKRYGSPEKVATVSKILVDEGIDLLLDLIVGLPNDKPEDVIKGVEFFLSHELESFVQVFPLSILPGTQMKKDSQKEGLIYDSLPPYRIISTPNFREEDIYNTLLEAEELLGSRVDEFPRPYLIEYKPESKETIRFPGEIPKFSLNRHINIWWEGGDNFYSQKDEFWIFFNQIHTKNPYCMADIILRPTSPFPIELIEWLQDKIRSLKNHYINKTHHYRGENMQYRIVIINSHNLPNNWIKPISDITTLYEDIKGYEYLQKNQIDEDSLYRIIDDPTEDVWNQLKKVENPDSICFGIKKWEEKWVWEVAGYGND